MKVSLITVVYNGESYIETCLRSIASQDYKDIEYIIMDGGSKDRTLEITERYRDYVTVIVSEPDKGLYDAMNKGIARATGDIVGILNSDDFYAHPGIISRVVQEFLDKQVDTVFGDLVFVSPENLKKVVRYYSPKHFRVSWFEKGDMPPHPTFFVKRTLYEKYGTFDTQYKIVSDFELMLRFLHKHHSTWSYIPEVLVHMRTGGISTRGFSSKIKLNSEMRAACAAHDVKTSMAKIYSKYFTKIFQLVTRPG
jgi:glycosyltransferase involved in cell wall biosynthesis